MRPQNRLIACLLGCLLFSTAVWAFGGGGGSGRKSTLYKGGVDAIGIHFGGKGKVDIDITNGENSGNTNPETPKAAKRMARTSATPLRWEDINTPEKCLNYISRQNFKWGGWSESDGQHCVFCDGLVYREVGRDPDGALVNNSDMSTPYATFCCQKMGGAHAVNGICCNGTIDIQTEYENLNCCYGLGFDDLCGGECLTSCNYGFVRNPDTCECVPSCSLSSITSASEAQQCCALKGWDWEADEEGGLGYCCPPDEVSSISNWMKRLFIGTAHAEDENICYTFCLNECPESQTLDPFSCECQCPAGTTKSSVTDVCCKNNTINKVLSVENGLTTTPDEASCPCPEDFTPDETGFCVLPCPDGYHPSKRTLPSGNFYTCCPIGYEINDQMECCGELGCCPISLLQDTYATFDSSGQCCTTDRLAATYEGTTTCCQKNEYPLPYYNNGTKYSACCSWGETGVQHGASSTGECCPRGIGIENGNSFCCGYGTHSEVDEVHGITKCCQDNEIIGPNGVCCTPGTVGCCQEDEWISLVTGQCTKKCTDKRPYYYCSRCHECPVDRPVQGWEVNPGWYSFWDGTCSPCPAHMTYSCEDGECSCPEGGYLASDSLSVCCSANGKSLDDQGKYTVDDPEHCGCPAGAEWKKGYPQGVCCKDGLAVDRQDNVLGIAIDVCGCPSTGKKVVTNEGRFCCKDGKVANSETGEYETSRYPAQFEACGCPDGGELTYKYGHFEGCCKDGKYLDWYADGTGQYEKPTIPAHIEACGCPDGGKKVQSGGSFNCCKDGKYLDWYADGTGQYETPQTKQKMQICCPIDRIAEQGTTLTCCPSGSYAVGDEGDQICCPGAAANFENVNGECCQKSRVAIRDGEKTCCADGTYRSGDSGNQICCPMGQQNINGHCQNGCPDGGSLSSDGTICCKDNKALGTAGNYNNVDVRCCPNGNKDTIGQWGFCCNSSKQVWVSREQIWLGSDEIFYGVPVTMICGCPSGSTLKNEFCCSDTKPGEEWDGTENDFCLCDEGEDPLYDDAENFLGCCPMNKLAIKDGERICCPNDTYAKGGTNDQICCKINQKNVNGECQDACDPKFESWGRIEWDSKKGYCVCPDGGEVHGDICCHLTKKLAWNSTKKDYTDIKPYNCGCPTDADGHKGEQINGTCCYDGCKWGGVRYNISDSKTCPCPDGGEYRGICCKDGKSWQNGSYSGIAGQCMDDNNNDGYYDAYKSSLASCPPGSTGYSRAMSRCCTADEELIAEMYCCPAGSTAYSPSTGCCAADQTQTYLDAILVCCDAGKQAICTQRDLNGECVVGTCQ